MARQAVLLADAQSPGYPQGNRRAPAGDHAAFLSEAVLLTGLGGLVGVVLGIGLTHLGEVAIPGLWPADLAEGTSAAPVPILSAGPILIAFGVSLLIGLAAGGYPAYRAARLRPIEALRFE